jgi:sterol desaturase/sphingolipid hydroxylase (fatty acid hydroxylase superfamily)
MEVSFHKEIKPQHKGTKQLFKNPIVERLSRTHIAIPLSLYAVIAAGFMYYGVAVVGLSVLYTIAMFFVGTLAFTLAEYLMHRYLYHHEPTTEKGKKFIYTVHGVHHEFPKDKDRLAMPPLLALVLIAILFYLFSFLMGKAVFAFLPGFIIGYSLYLFVHYAVHAYAPPKNFLKVLWVNHGIHHYKEPDRAYGVSSPLWDVVFRTLPESKK